MEGQTGVLALQKKKKNLSFHTLQINRFKNNQGKKKKGKRNFKFCAEGKEGKTIKSPN